MRITCLEEHVGDQAVAAATQDAAAKASYMAGVGSRYQDDPTPPDRPRLVAMQTAMATLGQPLYARIAAMDEAGIDMHVLSLTAPWTLVAILWPKRDNRLRAWPGGSGCCAPDWFRPFSDFQKVGRGPTASDHPCSPILFPQQSQATERRATPC